MDKQGANLFFQLIAKRYEKHSTIITTNQTFNKWGEVFSDNVLANAILDRLLHHSTVINIRGNSYRIKDKLQHLISETEYKKTTKYVVNNIPFFVHSYFPFFVQNYIDINNELL